MRRWLRRLGTPREWLISFVWATVNVTVALILLLVFRVPIWWVLILIVLFTVVRSVGITIWREERKQGGRWGPP